MLRADSSGVSTFAIWTLIRMANKGRVTQLLVLGIKLMPALARIAWQLGTARYRILEILCGRGSGSQHAIQSHIHAIQPHISVQPSVRYPNSGIGCPPLEPRHRAAR